MKIFRFKQNKELGAAALAMSVIFGLGVTMISMTSQQRQLNSTLALNELSVKKVLTDAIKESVKELGVFIPTRLVSWDGNTFSKAKNAPTDLPWEQAGVNLRKYGCVQQVAKLEDCPPDAKFRIIASVVGSPTGAALPDGTIPKYLELSVKADIHKTVLDSKLETELGVYIRQPDLPPDASGECPYIDTNVPFVPTYMYQFAKRFSFVGWAKVKPLQSFSAGGNYSITMNTWNSTRDSTHDHNGYFPWPTANIDTRSYYLRVNGWASWASLVIPRAKRNECVMHIHGFRKNGFRLGCFAQGTEIAVSPTETKPIEALQKGDVVYNPRNNSFQKIKSTLAGPEEEKDMVVISYNETKLTVTLDHPMPTNRGLIQAGEMQLGDRIQIANGDWVTPKLELIPSDGQIVYNLALEGPENENDHMVVANSIVTGDLDLQNMLIKKKNTVNSHKVAIK